MIGILFTQTQVSNKDGGLRQVLGRQLNQAGIRGLNRRQLLFGDMTLRPIAQFLIEGLQQSVSIEVTRHGNPEVVRCKISVVKINQILPGDCRQALLGCGSAEIMIRIECLHQESSGDGTGVVVLTPQMLLRLESSQLQPFRVKART